MLKGTFTEDGYRSSLIEASEHFRNSHLGTYVVPLIRESIGHFDTVCVISHTEDELEDYFVFLIDDDRVVYLTTERNPTARVSELKVISVDEYFKKLKRPDRIKLSVALDLARRS